jgi:hypothetical protein
MADLYGWYQTLPDLGLNETGFLVKIQQMEGMKAY